MAIGQDNPQPKPVRWIGSSRNDLKEFPEDVQRSVGIALWAAQIGEKASYAKPLKGFAGAGVLEIADDYDGDAYRAVYTVASPGSFTFFMPFRKNRSMGSPRRRMRSRRSHNG